MLGRLGLLLGWLLLGLTPGRLPELVQAELLLKQGRPGRALVLLEPLAKLHPDNQRVQFSYGLALARLGSCALALPKLLPHVDRRPLTPPAMVSIGSCLAQEGRIPEAVVLAREVVEAEPDSGPGWMLLARTLGLLGDVESAGMALDQVVIHLDASLFGSLQAELALRGRPDTVDGWLALSRRQAEGGVWMSQLELLRWLDVGDPVMAERAAQQLGARVGSSEAVRIVRAEVLRRLGLPTEAMAVLTTSAGGGFERAVRARVHIDLGQLEEAESLMATYPTPWDRTAWETEWYLARAKGDADAMANARARWLERPLPDGCALEHLVPL